MKRLVEESENELERSLLAAGMEEEPPAEVADRTLAALGLGGVAAGAALGVGTASAVKLGWLSVAKVAAGLALVSGVVVGGSYAVMKASTPPAPSPSADERALAADASAPVRADARPVRIIPNRIAEQRPTAISSAPSALSSSLAVRALPPTDAPPTDARAPQETSSASSAERLGEETKLLDQARNALRANDPDACLARLEAYKTRFPKGQLAADAAGLRRLAETKLAEAKKKDKAAP